MKSGERPLKKADVTKAQLERKLRGAQSDSTGLRYEQLVANYFARKGWSPRYRVLKYGYEYDLYAERDDIVGTEYLVVECKCKDRVSAKDVVRFLRKVDAVYRRLPQWGLEKAPLYAYLCYSEGIDEDASIAAKNHAPSVKLIKIAR